RPGASLALRNQRLHPRPALPRVLRRDDRVLRHGRGWTTLALAGRLGGGILALSLTVFARRRNRSWAWGLLGFLYLPGAGWVLQFLRRRCDRCRTLLPRDADRCRVCNDEPIPGT